KTGFTFRLKAGNGEIIGVSEVYTALSSCKNGIASVAKNAPVAEVEDQTKEGFEKAKNPKFEIYTDKAGETRFRLKAGNGETILASEGYSSLSGCKNGIESVRKNADSEIVMEEE
ncbi:MAG: YegP family protein, partial [Firmicutes bacterium]|nr:YegP family protein [Bacillota bacterium]